MPKRINLSDFITKVRVNGEIVCTIKNGVITWLKPKEEFEKSKKAMMKNVGEQMSRYLLENHDASLWNT